MLVYRRVSDGICCRLMELQSGGTLGEVWKTWNHRDKKSTKTFSEFGVEVAAIGFLFFIHCHEKDCVSKYI